MTVSIRGIDQAIAGLNYRNTTAVKYRLLNAIRRHYENIESPEALSAIDTDRLIQELWDIDPESSEIQSKRKNLNSIKSTINADLDRAWREDRNPEGVTLGPLNTFMMSNEAKDKVLSSFSGAVSGEGGTPSLEQIGSALKLISDYLSSRKGLDAADEMAKLRSVIDKISKDVGGGDISNYDLVEKGERSSHSTELNEPAGPVGGPDLADKGSSENASRHSVKGEEKDSGSESEIGGGTDTESRTFHKGGAAGEGLIPDAISGMGGISGDSMSIDEEVGDGPAADMIHDESMIEEVVELDDVNEDLPLETDEDIEIYEGEIPSDIDDSDEVLEVEESIEEEFVELEETIDEDVEEVEEIPELEEIAEDEALDLEEIVDDEILEEDEFSEMSESDDLELVEEADTALSGGSESAEGSSGGRLKGEDNAGTETAIEDSDILEAVEALVEETDSTDIDEIIEEDIETREPMPVGDGETEAGAGDLESELVELDTDVLDEMIDEDEIQELEELIEEDLVELDDAFEDSDEEVEEAASDEIMELDEAIADEQIELEMDVPEDELLDVDESTIDDAVDVEELTEDEVLELDEEVENEIIELDETAEMTASDEFGSVDDIADQTLMGSGTPADASSDALAEDGGGGQGEIPNSNLAGDLDDWMRQVGLPVDIFNENEIDPENLNIDPEKKKMLAARFDGYLGAMERYYNQIISVPAGRYLVGGKGQAEDERPMEHIELPVFYMGKFPITNAIFEIFVDRTGYVTTAEKLGYGYVYFGRFKKIADPKSGKVSSVWNASVSRKKVEGATWYQPLGPGSGLHNKRNHPVVQVSQKDAASFAAWTGKRLPKEAEWEAAARTLDGRPFPWGSDWQEEVCNIESSGISDTTAVDGYPLGENPLTIADLLGNVMEWTSDSIDPKFRVERKSIFYVAKGGGWIATKEHLLSYRARLPSDFSSNLLGFRCVVD